MNKKTLVLILLALLFVSGCKQSSLTNTPQSLSASSAYPDTPLDSDDFAYPGSEHLTPINSENNEILPDELDIPQPSEDTAVIYGQFAAKDGAGYAFLAGDVYLAPVIYSQGDVQLPFISLDPNSDPKADQRTSDHQFLFSKILPGTYGIVVHTPVSDYVVPDGLGDLLYLDVKPGMVIDLGVITIE